MSGRNEILVEVKDVSKKFSRNLKRGLWYGLLDIGKAILGKDITGEQLRKDEFWAVKDINFTLKRGECLGLIGHNGAGKSTLLKMLNGLIRPDQGTILMRGKVGALIELGAGFNPLLSGRENIYINGQLLGFTKKEIDAKLNTILEFAEIGDFIDTPVQNYSSGMKVRLGFAVAAQMEPDVLIIDEVLAVGDLGFVLKCFSVIDNILPNTAVIFVSHNMPQVSRICTKVLLMDRGKEMYLGNEVSKGIDFYYSNFGGLKKTIFAQGQENGISRVEVVSNNKNNGIPIINWLDDIDIIAEFETASGINKPHVAITIYDKEQRPLGVSLANLDIEKFGIVKNEKNYFCVKIRLPKVQFSQGKYSVTITISESESRKPILRVHNVAEFQVSSKHQVFPPFELFGEWS